MQGDQQQTLLHWYQIQILNVKMKIKFNCRMRIEYLDQALTSDIETGPSNQQFTKVNQKVRLNETNTEDNFGLSICLITSKGNKYPAGIAVMYYRDLQNISQKQKKSFQLSKCLDQDSFIEIAIVQREMTVPRMMEGYRSSHINIEKNQSGDHILINKALQPKQAFGFQSQSPLSGLSANRRKNQGSIISKSRKYLNKTERSNQKLILENTRHKKHQSPVQTHQRNRSILKTPQTKVRYNALQKEQFSIDNLTPSHETFQKLKQKVKHEAQTAQKQLQKRLALEDIEGTLKLEVLRGKIRCQELQKQMGQIIDENENLKQKEKGLLIRCSELQERLKKGSQKTTNETINRLQSQIKTAKKQITEFKQKNAKLTRCNLEKEVSMKNETEGLKKRINKIEAQLEIKQSNLNRMTKESQNYSIAIEEKDRIIRKLEEELSAITYQKLNKKDIEIRSLQSAKVDMQRVIENMSRKIAQLQSDKIKKDQQVESSKAKIATVEHNYTLIQKTNATLRNEATEIPKMKEKQKQYLLMISKLEGQKKGLLRNIESLKKHHLVGINNLEQKLKKDAMNNEQTTKELQRQLIGSRMKVKDLENQINYNLKGELTNHQKTNEKLQRDLQNAKDTERNMSKQLRSIELKLSSVNTQLQTLKMNSANSQTMFKLQTERLYSQINNLKQQLEKQIIKGLGLKQKNQQLSASNNLLNCKVSQQLQFHKKVQKQSEGRIQQYSKLVGNLEEQLHKKDEMNRQITDKQRTYVDKIKEYNINENEYIQILTKYENDLNSLSKQNQNLQDKLRHRNSQFDKINSMVKNLEERYGELDEKYKQATLQNKQFFSEVNSLSKEKDQLDRELGVLKDSLANKQKIIERLNNMNEQQNKDKSTFKNDLLKLENKAETIKKEHTIFKEHLYDLISREFGSIQGLGINLCINDIRTPALSRYEGGNSTQIQRSGQKYGLISNQSSPPSQNEIIDAITSFTKQTRTIINSLKDQLKETTNQLEQLHNQMYQANNTLSQTIKQKTQKIYQLQKKMNDQMESMARVKKQYHKKNDTLKLELKKFQEELESALSLNEELVFSMNGLKMANETEHNYYQQIIKQNKEVIMNLDNKYSQIYENNTSLSLQKGQLSLQLRYSNEEVDKLKLQVSKITQKIEKLEGEQSMKDSLIGELKTKNKQLIQKISESQLRLSTEKQLNENNKRALSEEEKKLVDTKDFINNLIKEKQHILKEEINNKQRSLELEAVNLHLTNRIETLDNSQQHLSKQLQIQKEANKKLFVQTKNLEVELQAEKAKHKRAAEKLKDKQKQLNIKLEALQGNESSLMHELSQKSKQIKGKSQQIEMLRKIHHQEIQQSQEEVSKLEEELFKVKQELKYGLYALQNSNKQLNRTKKMVQEKSGEISGLKEKCKTLEQSKGQLESNLNNLLEELNEKDQRVYSMAGEISSLEGKYQQRIIGIKKQQEIIEDNMNCKYEAMCEDYQLKVEEIEKERDYLNQKVKVMEQQVKRMEEKIKMIEYDDKELLMKSQDRLIKVESDKNSLISNLRAQIKKTTEQKLAAAQLNNKYSMEIQSLKASVRNLQTLSNRQESKNKQHEEKIRELKDDIAKTQQQGRKKALEAKQLEQGISNYQWSLERELKKQFQNISKSLVNLFKDSKQNERQQVIDHIQGIESRMIKLLNSKI